jgi:Ser/Thr protein kinase RdoA (MazF antagonist)
MSLLKQAPRYDLAEAVHLVREMYGVEVSTSALPSERDQNFLLTTTAGERYVLKVANAAEDRAMLEAQNAAMAHVAGRVAFCPRVLPTITGDTIGIATRGSHLVRLVTYLPGVPLATAGARTPALLDNLGRAIGRLDAALVDFDHPAIHRDFHWDFANAAHVIGEYLPLVPDDSDRELVQRATAAALPMVEARQSAFRRSIIHNDANDWNVLVTGDRVVGIIDFGDMVHSWTVADPAVAVAYAMFDASDPLATAAAIVRGYHGAHPLRDEELAAVIPLASLRLCMSVCIAAWQQRQRPDDEYLGVSQEPIRRTLPVLAAIAPRVSEQALREACR